MNSHTTMSKGTVPGSSTSTKATTTLPLDNTTTALPACVMVAPLIDADLTIAGLTAVVNVLVMDAHGVPPAVGLLVPTNAAALSYQMCNAMLVSGSDTRRPAATCLLSLFLLIAMSKRICWICSIAPSRRHGSLVGRTGLEVPLGCLARLCILIGITTTSHLTTLT